MLRPARFMEAQNLLELADDVAADGEYESAYHLLMAALHLAEHHGDRDAVDHIAMTGARLAAAVEAVVPPHRLSREQAAKRGHHAIYDSLETHANAVRLRMESAAKLGRFVAQRA
jgi:hypothetical protein